MTLSRAGRYVIQRERLAVALLPVLILLNAASLSAEIICNTTGMRYYPRGGCNIGQGGQPMVHHDKCSCDIITRRYTNTDTGNSWSEIYTTCAPALVGGKNPTGGSTTYPGYEQMTISFKQQPTGAAWPARFLRCENGFADLRDSSGNPLEPAGPCGGGDWTMQLPEKSFEVRMNGIHYPSITDCGLAKEAFFTAFQKNVPLKNLCKQKDATAVPTSIVRLECAGGTKANGFIGGSVLSAVVTCQGN